MSGIWGLASVSPGSLLEYDHAARMMKKRFWTRALRPLLYVCLDVSVGSAIYVISVGEADLTLGQLAIRILTGMALASAIVGGPDIMLYWQESGRRIAAEERADAAEEKAGTATKERDAAQEKVSAAQEKVSAAQEKVSAVTKERDATAKELDAAVAERDAAMQRIDELSAVIEQLQNGRSSRRSRRRRLRNNGS